MRAAYFDGSGMVRLERTAEPVPLAGEAVVQVEYCAFCGSDKRLLKQGSPYIPGHEIVGRVLAVDEDTSPARAGDPVAVYSILHCGTCAWCRRGATNRCSAMAGLVGWQVDGGFAELVRVPARNLLPIPADIPLQQAVLSLDTLGTAAHGVRRALAMTDAEDRSMLVLGCGPLGLGVVAMACHSGISVFAHDLDLERVEAAVALGAVAWGPQGGGAEVASGEAEVRSRFSLVVEASGAPAAKSIASEAVDQGGAVLMLGEGEQPWTLPASVRWRRTEAVWTRSFYFPINEADANWELVRAVGAPLEELLLTVEPLSQISAVAERFLAGRVTKPVIAMGPR